VAGLSVSGPIARITTKRIKAIAATLQSAAAAISQQIRLLPSSEWA
jgi:DNA-binding IclR family transcriptional regulator